jgi:predicted Zn finger-like uncharacterized protein
MKISCQSCAAKYTIADEKVVGKIVKIRCKKCSATIVINGNDTAALAAGGADTSGMPDFAPTESVAGEPWTVNVADGDQRTLTIGEIVQLYKAGIIVEDSYCWRDGMGDWLPLREIEMLHGACTARSTIEPDLEAGIFRPELGSNTSLEDAPTAALSGAASAALAPHASPAASPVFSDAPAPAAARRVGGGRAGGADLFGAVAKAGGDDDVMTSVPMSGAGARASAGGGGGGGELEEPKLTGQRNESSVLFSLSALTEKAPDAPSSTKQTEGSGLIDIRALAAPRSGPVDSGRGKVDDIMNLGGGGAFSAALAAPVLAPPPVGVEASFDHAAPAAAKSNKPIVFAIIGAALFLGLVMVFMMTKSGGDKDKMATTGPNGVGMPAGSSLADNNGAGTTTPAPPTGGDPAAAAATSAAPSTAAAPGTGQPLAVAPTPGKSGSSEHGGSDHRTASHNSGAQDNTPDPTPAPAPAPAQKQNMNQALAAFGGDSNSGSSSASSGGGTAPFDRGAAAATLGAVNVASCKKSDGPTGSGHVSITFGSNGQVQTAVVDSPPFEGTSVGGCVAGKFRAAHVPSFSGGAQRVGKSFTIN